MAASDIQANNTTINITFYTVIQCIPVYIVSQALQLYGAAEEKRGHNF